MIWALSILAAIASSAKGQSEKARVQQISGRLGLRQPKEGDRPPDLRKRLDWAWKTFPKARLTLLIMFGNPYKALLRYKEIPYVTELLEDHREAGDYEEFWRPVRNDPRRLTPGSEQYTSLWPNPGFREPDLERLIPFLVQTASAQPLEKMYEELRAATEEWDMKLAAAAMADMHREYREPDEIFESPYDEAETLIEHGFRWTDSEDFDDIQDPWLKDLREPDEDGNGLRDELSPSWGLTADDLKIAPVEISWNRKVHEIERRGKITGHDERFALQIKVFDPENPSAFIVFQDIELPRRSCVWNITEIGPGLLLDEANFEKALAKSRVGRESPNDDGTWTDEPIHNWADIVPLLRRAIRVDAWPQSVHGILDQLPPLEDLQPAGPGIEADWDSIDESDLVHYKLRPEYWASDEFSNRALWQLRWLFDSAQAWSERIDQLRSRLLLSTVRYIRDEVGVTGEIPTFHRKGDKKPSGEGVWYTTSTITNAYDWAQRGHWDRANATWWKNYHAELRQEASPLELSTSDVAVATWPDGGRVVELTTPEALRREGDSEKGMDHCVGASSHVALTTSGQRRAFSYRDAENRPIATLEVHNTRGFPTSDLQGYSNGAIKDEANEKKTYARERMSAFIWWLRGSRPRELWALKGLDISRLSPNGENARRLLEAGAKGMQVPSTAVRVEPRRGSKKKTETWVHDLIEIENDDGDIVYVSEMQGPIQDAIDRLEWEFEDRVEVLLGERIAAGFAQEEPDLHIIAYQSFASLGGHGVGLWAGQEWENDFEPTVLKDDLLGRIFNEINETYRMGM